MKKRIIAIVGIVLIMIAFAIIGTAWSRVETPPAGSRESAALGVWDGVGAQVNVARVVVRRVARVGGRVPVSLV